MFKNVAASFMVFAFDTTTGVAKTGDAANITAYVSKDYGAVTVLADTTAAEMEATNGKGYYLFAAAQGETNADCLMVSAKSSTANISVIGAPAVIYTRPTTGWLAPATAGRTLVVDAAGLADANVVKAGPTGSGAVVPAGAIPNAVAGAAGGVFIAGSNAATTVASLAVTAGVSIANAAGVGLNIIGGGSAAGLRVEGGATGSGVFVQGGATSGKGMVISGIGLAGISIGGDGAGSGVEIFGGATGHALEIVGGSTSGDGINITTTSGDGIDASGATVGVPIRGNITGNITGNISGSVGSVTAFSAAAIQSIWDALTSALTTAGSIGKWILDKLDVVVSTRSSQTSVDDLPTNSELATALGTADDAVLAQVALVKAKTDAIPAAPAAVGDVPTAVQNADALLDRNMGTGTDSGNNTTVRTVRQALRVLRNKWSISGTTQTFTKEDDLTTSHTAVLTGTAGADPVTASDANGP